MAEIAGAEPAVAGGFGVGIGIIEIPRENAGADNADLAGLERFEFAPLIVLDRDLHARAFESASADPRMRAVLGGVQLGRAHGDIAGDLPEAEILHQHLADLL